MIRFIAFLTLILVATTGFSKPLQVTDAWIKYLPPVIPMRAGYMQLTNQDEAKVTIISISSDAFKKIELHKTINSNGMMSMHPVKNLMLEPHATIILKPGALHLMLMKPKRKLKIGDEIEVTLRFDNNTSQSILMTVKK